MLKHRVGHTALVKIYMLDPTGRRARLARILRLHYT